MDDSSLPKDALFLGFDSSTQSLKAIVLDSSLNIVTSDILNFDSELLALCFPRHKKEEEIAISKHPADVGYENGETVIDKRKIRIKALSNVKKTNPKPPRALLDIPISDLGIARRNSSHLETYLDPAFMSIIEDPDQRRKEQWERIARAQNGFNFAKMLGFGDFGGPKLSAAEEHSLHSRYLTKSNSLNLSEIAEMKILSELKHALKARSTAITHDEKLISSHKCFMEFLKSPSSSIRLATYSAI
ncbi:hypothetical protein L2E82_18272 [Cichorium intybus]|uniref:Uncharacterized protein n=1 Tax=Cichorium intybus TaxID=13427 RepID=A0ACB9F905_CICIN|nr:hypothetical protein L2E82_18272 [Cichorium intybus]